MYSYHGMYKMLLIAFIFNPKQTSSQGLITFPAPSTSNACEDTAGRKGTCRPINECSYALANLSHERPTHCEFRGRIPLVCCVEVLDISPPDNIPVCGKQSTLVFEIEISNGLPSNLNEWPWMALLGTKKEDGVTWFCSGVLIDSKWILTAAHCPNTRNANVVRLGENNYNDMVDDGSQHVDVAVARVIYHDSYKHPESYHDLALIELDNHISFTDSISPVCLPWGEEGEKTNLVGRDLTVTGWGAQYFRGPLTEQLMKAELKGISNEHCEESYSALEIYQKPQIPQGINQNILCVGDAFRQGRDTCQGDSGGPSVYRGDKGQYFLGGIVSTGYGCGKNDFPGIQVRVAHPQNLAWIKKNAFT